jgi:shikimate kinase
LVGVACVGKTTVGGLLADRLGYEFVGFDAAVEEALGDSVERLKNAAFNEYAYRQIAKPVLRDVLAAHPEDLVLAMPPGGLFREYKQQFDRQPDIVTVALRDRAINILRRITFYDEDSVLMPDYVVKAEDLPYYYEEIKADIAYFYAMHRKAHIQFKIAGRDAETVARDLAELLRPSSGA